MLELPRILLVYFFFHSLRYIRSSVSHLQPAYLDLFKWQIFLYIHLFSIVLFVFVRPRLALSDQTSALTGHVSFQKTKLFII